MGISRSATVVAAYLTFRHGLTPDQAITWLRIRRPIVYPNSGFREQLHDYYSVLQIDHGPDFGWRGLSMCSQVQLDEAFEQRKREKRLRVKDVRKRWKEEDIEWVRCELAGWDETVERLVQQQLSK
jgi:hypothetical protein